MHITFLDLLTHSALIGIGATIIMDIWAILLKRLLSITPLNYALVGRWLLHISQGTFRHNNINTAKTFKSELMLGWAAHYLIGVVFAAVLIIIIGNEWLSEPTMVPAITFGLLTVSLPFFIMQPGMGLGIAAAKTPKPYVARFRSMLTHLIFGLGLYICATLIALF